MHKKAVLTFFMSGLLFSALFGIRLTDNAKAQAIPSVTVTFANGTNSSAYEYRLGNTFRINVTVDSPDIGVWSWQIGMHFNSSVLECTNFGNGRFFAGRYTLGFQSGTIHNDVGYVTFSSDSLRLPETEGVKGSGVLMWFEFRVKVSMYTSCLLDLTLSPPDLTCGTKLGERVNGNVFLISPITLYDGLINVTRISDLGGGAPPTILQCDGVVDGKDLALFLLCYKGLAPPNAKYLGDLGSGLPPEFLKFDGKVDRIDLALFLMCFRARTDPVMPSPLSTETKYAGLATHPAGHQTDYPPRYWVNATKYISLKVIRNSEPIVVWVVGVAWSGGICYLPFPSPGGSYPSIIFSLTDKNEEYLDAFDTAGIKVWLIVEPSTADVETLIDLVLGRYKNHTSIVGLGIDIEWYRTEQEKDGKHVTNEEVTKWLDEIKSYNSTYRLLLVHWEITKMPTLHPKDVIFVDDAQGFGSLDTMVNSFKNWGNNFPDANVGFSIGFLRDESWWSKLSDPGGQITNKLFNEIPNCKEVYWVSWSIPEIFPF